MQSYFCHNPIHQHSLNITSNVVGFDMEMDFAKPNPHPQQLKEEEQQKVQQQQQQKQPQGDSNEIDLPQLNTILTIKTKKL